MKKKLEKFIIDVAPFAKIPLTTGKSFSYLSENPLEKGTVVSVPLFHRNISGVVLNTRKDFKRLGNIELKKINKLILENFLTSEQLELANFISDYYIYPLGVILKNFVPDVAKARKKEKIIIKKENKKIILTKEQKSAVQEISKSQKLAATCLPKRQESFLYLVFWSVKPKFTSTQF